MKNFVFALALAGLALTGCANEEAEVTDVTVEQPAEVTTPPADDMMMADTTMAADSTDLLMEADTTMAEPTTEM